MMNEFFGLPESSFAPVDRSNPTEQVLFSGPTKHLIAFPSDNIDNNYCDPQKEEVTLYPSIYLDNSGEVNPDFIKKVKV